MRFSYGSFDCKIIELETFNVLEISVHGVLEAKYSYEKDMYMDEYIQSTITPGLIRNWLERQLSKDNHNVL